MSEQKFNPCGRVIQSGKRLSAKCGIDGFICRHCKRIAQLEAKVAAAGRDTRRFPLQRHGDNAQREKQLQSCPWWVAEIAYLGYATTYPSSARSQSLERMAERGGFDNGEMDEFFPGWRKATDAAREASDG